MEFRQVPRRVRSLSKETVSESVQHSVVSTDEKFQGGVHQKEYG